MIDHLTPYEGVVFGALVALGIVASAWASGESQFYGACTLAIGVIGGTITLVRGLAIKAASTMYLLVLVMGLVSLLVKLFVFPADPGVALENVWIAIAGLLGAGVIGLTLNALIRGPAKDSTERIDPPDETDPQAATGDYPHPDGFN